MTKSFTHVKFEMFVDRPFVMARIEAWKLRILGRTGAYGMGVMRRQFRRRPTGRRARGVTVNGKQYLVPPTGMVVDVATGRAARTAEAQAARQEFYRQHRGEGVGKPPFRGPTDLLRSMTYFGVDPAAESTVVGPYPFDSQPPLVGAVSVPQLLDQGGEEMIAGQLVHYDPRPFVAPSLGPTQRFMEKVIEDNPIQGGRTFGVKVA